MRTGPSEAFVAAFRSPAWKGLELLLEREHPALEAFVRSRRGSPLLVVGGGDRRFRERRAHVQQALLDLIEELGVAADEEAALVVRDPLRVQRRRGDRDRVGHVVVLQLCVVTSQAHHRDDRDRGGGVLNSRRSRA